MNVARRAAEQRYQVGVSKQLGATIDFSAARSLGKRTAARMVFYDARLTSPMEIMTPLAKQLDVTLVPGAESVISSSVPLRTALRRRDRSHGRPRPASVTPPYK